MKKKLSFMVVVLLLPVLAFAGELSFNLKGDYNLPVSGWNSRNGIANGFDYVAADKLIGGGVTGTVGMDYWFSRSFALGISAGFGFNELFYRDYSLFVLPATIDMSFAFIRTENTSFPLRLSLGAYGECRDNKVSFGGIASLMLGIDVRFTKHFSFGFESGARAFFEPVEKLNNMSIQLDVVPLTLAMKFWV